MNFIKAVGRGIKTGTILVATGYLLGFGFSIATSQRDSLKYYEGYRDAVDECTKIVEKTIEESEKKAEENA